MLEEAFRVCEPKISEYTFTNLFVWRERESVLVSRIGETVLIKRWNIESNRFLLLPPIGNKEITDVIGALSSTLEKKDLPPIYGLDARQGESLKKIGFTVKEMRDSWDYVYLIRDLIDLPGEKYYVKRKNIKRCLQDYKPEYRSIAGEFIGQCVNLETTWCNLRNCSADPSLEAENRAIKELFLHFSDLNVLGGVILIDGSVEAFTIGEKLNKDTAVIHFEKANPNIPGLYQVINQWFCSQALHEFKYINREQDLGIPGLRQAKMSYHPAFFIEKFLATV